MENNNNLENFRDEEEFLNHTCDSCGGSLEVDEMMSSTTCPYCGKTVVVNPYNDFFAEKDPVIQKAMKVLKKVKANRSTKHITPGNLWLRGAKFKEKHLEAIKQMKYIHNVDLTDSDMDDTGLQSLKGHIFIQKLNLSDSRVTDKGLEVLPDLISLNDLTLDYLPITNEGMKYVAQVKKLNRLSIRDTQVTHDGIIELLGLKGLKSLHYSIMDKKIKPFPILNAGGHRFYRDVTYLDLDDSGISDEDLKCLENIRKIESLHLAGNQIKGAGLAHLSSGKRLEELFLYNNPLEKEAIPILGKFKRLKHLSVRSTNLTDADKAELGKLLPNTEIT